MIRLIKRLNPELQLIMFTATWSPRCKVRGLLDTTCRHANHE